MRVNPKHPHKLLYSLSFEEGFGNLIHGYIFQLNENGTLTLQHQRVTPQSLIDFPEFYTSLNQDILEIIEEFSLNALTKRFSKRPIKPQDFIKKFCTQENLEKYIQPYLQIRLSKIFNLLKGQNLYIRNRDNPAEHELLIEFKPAQATFKFRRKTNGTQYFLEVFHNGTYMNICELNCELFAHDGAWIKVGQRVYHFENDIDGKRLVPFFDKYVVNVPKASEKTYFEKFVKLTAEKFPTVIQGVNVSNSSISPSFLLLVSSGTPNRLTLKVKYKKEQVDFDNPKKRLVIINKTATDFDLECIDREHDKEQEFVNLLKTHGFKYIKNARFEPIKNESLLEKLSELKPILDEYNAQTQLIDFDDDIVFGKPTLTLDIKNADGDWFDIKAVIKFGDIEVPFLKIRKNILDRNPKLKLPNGKTVIIPEEWFSELRYLFAFSEKRGDGVGIKKQFASLLEESKSIKPKLPNQIDKKELELDTGLANTLRSYQKDGFKWLSSLHTKGFSGVLADDMGLGKTLQTIALIKSIYNSVEPKKDRENLDLFTYTTNEVNPTLIVVPSSLLFNWANELRKFAPSIKFFIHFGTNRLFDEILFKRHHVIITSYGLIRNDFDFLSKIKWEYLILDESHNIKNPLAQVTKKVGQLKSNNRLALTGTPIENSLTDLWSQMNFLNQGLLGSYTFFKSEFVTPIEKNESEEQKSKLRKLVYPFVLRRTKEQVAKELPPLTEQTILCEMNGEQAKLYEKVKSEYRNYILDQKSLDPKQRFLILKGLTELRLIANHPSMYNQDLDISSGKFEEVADRLQSVHNAKHKILVFSQFTRHLNIFREHLDQKKLKYSLLTGSTTKRQEAVEAFTDNENCNIFLISLKAGGVGLNLTKADYVFILDPWWNPFAEKQAIDRAYRIGQKSHVFSYKFITKNTIEEKILQLQRKKKTLASDFIPEGGKATLDLDQEELKELFE
ncbi:MAG: DEAD/DEAH box helicase [Bacteroidia bacterium]